MSRSAAARKGWETRRAKAEAEARAAEAASRSAAARKGWETRRAKQEAPPAPPIIKADEDFDDVYPEDFTPFDEEFEGDDDNAATGMIDYDQEEDWDVEDPMDETGDPYSGR